MKRVSAPRVKKKGSVTNNDCAFLVLNLNRRLLAAGPVCDGVDHLLRKCMEQNRSHAAPFGDDRVESCAPGFTVFTLALTPVADDGLEGACLIPCCILSTTEAGICFRKFPLRKLDGVLVLGLDCVPDLASCCVQCLLFLVEGRPG